MFNSIALHIGTGDGTSPIALVIIIVLVLYLTHKVSVAVEREEAKRREQIKKFKEEHPDEEAPIETMREEMIRVFIEHARDSFKNK